jgi:hypothetical protein
MAHKDVELAAVDPCGEFGPTQKWALVWFLGVLVLGTMFVNFLMRTDRHMYRTGGDPLDYAAYTENRVAQYTIPRDVIDERRWTEVAGSKETRAGVANAPDTYGKPTH